MIVTPEPSDHLRVVALIQARMGSTRLPGKVLRPIAGKPLLWHIVHRLKRSQFIESIAIATSTNPRDDAIVEFGRDHDVIVVRGPEDDVLARFARAAEILDADIIVRVSADAPFVDAGFIDHLITSLLEQNGDYVLLEDGAIAGHEGVDPFSRRALDKLMMDASDDPIAREHVTGYFKAHPDFVRIARAPAYPPLARAGGRLTIDTPDDLAFVEAVHERMAAKAGEASLADLLLLLEREPGLRALNAHVRQKALDGRGGVALIRCDGGGQFGYGHVKRMVALARALRDREGIGAVFAVNGTRDAVGPITRAGFEAMPVKADRDAEDLRELIDRHRPGIFVCDMREGIGRDDLAKLASHVELTAVIDDGSDRRLAADVAYYPPVPQALALDWRGSQCERHIGWQWSILGLGKPAAAWRNGSPRPTLLVTMGGSDPAGLTLQAARALARLDPVFRARFVIGPGVEDRTRIARAIVALAPHFETLEGADGLATEFASCDLALAAFGVTAYELAAYGVPALYLCLTEDHASSASAFEDAGMGQSLGLASRVEDREIAHAVWTLLGDSTRRREMRSAGLTTIDGEGAARVAAHLAAKLAQSRGGGTVDSLGPRASRPHA
ncbi:MAG: cytidylyltransferase domain-containing protein [Rhizomicrobium sp.]